jgi:hypothetical protein
LVSIRRQCELLGVNRSSLDYVPKGESELNLAVMRMIDETHTKIPFYGRRRMREHLFRQGVDVNVKRVGRLMKAMGIETIYPRRNLSKPNPEHRVFPYLLRGVRIERQDFVWSTDITYIRMRHGFMYLVAIMDWYSRYVLASQGCALRVALGDPESFQLQPFGRCIFLASANWRRGDSSLLSGDGSKVFVRLTLFVAAPTSATL